MAHFEDGTVTVKKFSVGSMDNNCYIVSCPRTKEAVIIDAATDAPRILKEAEGVKVKSILTTHGHWDHIGAIDEVKQALNVPDGIGAGDADKLKNRPSFLVEDGQVFEIGDVRLRAIHNPGHTPGSTSYVLEGKMLFSGDTLFPGGPGNTQKDPARFATVMNSLRSRLFAMPDNVIVMPGHGKDTTLGTERPHLDEWQARGW